MERFMLWISLYQWSVGQNHELHKVEVLLGQTYHKIHGEQVDPCSRWVVPEKWKMTIWMTFLMGRWNCRVIQANIKNEMIAHCSQSAWQIREIKRENTNNLSFIKVMESILYIYSSLYNIRFLSFWRPWHNSKMSPLVFLLNFSFYSKHILVWH